MKFELNQTQLERLKEFKKDCYQKDLEAQKADENFLRNDFVMAMWDEGFPYHGAIGGAFTYCFTPNSIGETQVVQFQGSHHKAEIDLTDYEKW